MTQRPEILWPLFADLTTLTGIGPKTATALARVGIETPGDLILTLPLRAIDRRLRPSIRDVVPPDIVTVEVEIGTHHPPRNRHEKRYLIEVHDAQESFHVIFFKPRGEWVRKALPHGQKRVISGRIEVFDSVMQMPHPDHILLPSQAHEIPDFEPVYPLTKGLKQSVMTRAIQAACANAPDFAEWIEPGLKAKRGWPGWRDAVRHVHNPQGAADIEAGAPARQRLAYDDFLAHQLALALMRHKIKRVPGIASVGDNSLRDKVLAALPYDLTGAQTRAISEITADLASPERMYRMLQGDVGAGKTLVAFMAMVAAVEAGGQAALMAPTELLARQHHAALSPLAEAAGLRLGILTGRDKGTTREAICADLASGTLPLVVGTHALFQPDVHFADLRLAVIDEQHRFGVRQRMDLGRKGPATDILLMTATPIPRSLTLAHFGAMDLSILDEKPPGRQPVKTALMSSTRLSEVITHLRDAIASGRQAYWVCPLVEESEAAPLAAAQDRYEQLRAALGDTVGLVHGQMPARDRDAVMGNFQDGKLKLLVATTVIEVGVDVPNASIMVVEAAQAFGLSQLHQLRGRVGRGAAASTCLLLYDPPLGADAQSRLETLRRTEDGFEIAEEDLRLRRSGDILGVQQSGLPKFRVADAETQTDLMQIAHDDARMLLGGDPDLQSTRGQSARLLLGLMRQDTSLEDFTPE